MTIRRFAVMACLILSMANVEICNAQKHEPNSIVGSWKCEPYTLHGNDGTVVVTETDSYRRDGSFLSLGTYTEVYSSGLKVTGKVKMVGSWKLAGLKLSTKETRAKYLYSDNPQYTVAMGQKQWDAIMKQPSWDTAEIVQYGPPLIIKARYAVHTCR